MGQSIPKNGSPRITLAGDTAAVYWSMAVLSLNIVLVSDDRDDVLDPRLSWYAMTKKALTAGARALML